MYFGSAAPVDADELLPRRSCAWVLRSPARIIGTVAAVVLATGALWVGVTAVMARNELDAVANAAPTIRAQVTAADISHAIVSAGAAARHARRAHDLTSGPAWGLVTRIPGLGEPFRTAQGITVAADELGRNALPSLVDAGTTANPAKLRSADGQIDVAALRRIGPQIDAAAASIERATLITDALPTHTWLGAVDRARTDVLEQLKSIGRAVTVSGQAARLFPPMLGVDRPKTYFVVFQNNAEARGTGGLPGAFAIVRADQGRIRFERFENDSALEGVTADVQLGPEYAGMYGKPDTSRFPNGNLSPHFPYAAAIWASMWRRHSGQQVDGVLAIDPQALGYLLAVTGPARLPDGGEVSAENVVALTESTAYLSFGADTLARKSFLLEVARAAAGRITAPSADTAGLARALTQAAQERRLLAWSADPALEEALEVTAISGAVPETTAPYVGMTVINEAGNKLDYYLDRALTWERTGCGRRREVTVTMTLTNHAPRGLADYVILRADRPSYPVKPGDHHVAIAYAGTAGARMRSVTVDGAATGAASGMERGHPVHVVGLELPRGRTRTVVFRFSEPAAEGTPIVFRQPLVRPLTTTLRDQRC